VGSAGTDPSDGREWIGEFSVIGETVGMKETDCTSTGKTVMGMFGLTSIPVSVGTEV
jgi:hypothetical protein